MARNVKDPKERRDEFVETAQELFREKGYYNTSVEDIVERMGVAKGLFYYYFGSKEDLVEAIADRLWEGAVDDYRTIMEREDLSAMQKLLLYSNVRGQVKVRQTYLLDLWVHERHSPLVQRLTEKGVEMLVPILGEIISQGVEEGSFDTGYPFEAAEFLIRGATTLLNLDTGDPEQVMRGFRLSLDLWERVLGAERGSFLVMVEQNRDLMEEFARQAQHFKEKDGEREGDG